MEETIDHQNLQFIVQPTITQFKYALAALEQNGVSIDAPLYVNQVSNVPGMIVIREQREEG